MTLRLTSRIVLFFLFLAAGLLTIVGVLSYRSASKSLERAAMADMLGNAIEKEAQLDMWIEEQLAEIGLIAREAAVVEETATLIAAARASEGARSARARLMEELQPHLDGRSHFYELFVMDPKDGRVVASSRPAEEGKSSIGHPYFDKGKTDLYLQAPSNSVDLTAPAMTAAVPLRATDGRVVAVLAARLDLADINVIVQRRTALHETEDSYLVNAERYLVTQPRFIREPAVLRRKIDTESARQSVAGNNGVMVTADYRGVPSIAAYRWDAKHQVGLVVKMDYTEALAPARAFGRSLVLISSLALLAAAGLAFVLARSITRPLRMLQKSVRRFGGADGDQPLPAAAGDEVTALAREFDQMAARIGERTAELATTNEALRTENAERKRAEESLRTKEYALSESQRLGHIGSWFYDMTGQISWSEEMYRLCGVSPDTFIPTLESLLTTMHPDDRPAMQAWIAACAAGEAPGALEYRVILPDGTIRFMRGDGQAVFGAGNQLLHMAGTVQDVTERKAAESALIERSRLSALTADVGVSLTRGLSLNEMLQGCAAALVQHLDAAFARVWTLNEQTNVLELQASAGMYTHLDGPHGRVPVGKFKIGLIAEERQPHVTNHVIDDPRVGDQEWARREGMVSFAGHPLEVNGRVVGVMALFARQRLPVATLKAMAGIASGIALGIERMRTDAALRESEQRMRQQTALLEAQLESALDGLLVLDNDGRQILRNDRFVDMWKLPGDVAEELDDRKRLEFAANQTKNPTQFLETIGHLYSHPDATIHDEIEMVGGAVLERYSGPVRARDGTHYGRIFNFRDITASKLAQEEREKLVALIENSADFIGMATLEGKPFFVNRAGREMVGLDRDVCSTTIAEYSDEETAALLQHTAIPATFATGHWMGEGVLRHFQTRALIPVHIHALLVRNPDTREPICIATVQRNITDIKEAEKKLEKANRALQDLSRLSGMAEVATSVLHNVGNVLNSVNVSADRISDKVKRLKPASLEKVAALLRAHAHDLPEFLARDPQGKELPGYLAALIDQLADPQKDIIPELVSLKKNVDHIREIVRRQQSYAHRTSILETMALTDLVEDAISINAASLTRHDVQLIREYSPVPRFPIDKHKVLQILVNLLSNAKHALDAAGGRDRRLTVRIAMNGSDRATVSITDNGVGIAPENLTRIFQHGFTTRDGGHGFGLHSGALAAQELGGSLTVTSAGPGQGAVFTLALPCHVSEQAA